MIDLFLFDHPTFTPQASDIGAAAVILDFESTGKGDRQAGYDTLISKRTPDDIAAARRSTTVPLICRVDGPDGLSAPLVERLVEEGVSEVLVPMIRSPRDLERALTIAADRLPVGTLVETDAAVDYVEEIASLAPSRIYLGLNDLWIDRRTPNRFHALVDGTAETVAAAAQANGVPFGVAGLTAPDEGHPLPCHHLLTHLVRLDAAFTFLRRSFFDAAERRGAAALGHAIRAAADRAATRRGDVAQQAIAAAVDAIEHLGPDHDASPVR